MIIIEEVEFNLWEFAVAITAIGKYIFYIHTTLRKSLLLDVT